MNIDELLDKIYELADKDMCAGKFESLDRAIQLALNKTDSTIIILAVLTATLPVKSKLPTRPALYDKALHLLGPEAVKGLE